MVHLLLIKYTDKNETNGPSAYIPHKDVLFQKISYLQRKRPSGKKTVKHIENDYNLSKYSISLYIKVLLL